MVAHVGLKVDGALGMAQQKETWGLAAPSNARLPQPSPAGANRV